MTMKKITTSIIAGVFALTGSALANEFEDHCVAITTDSGGDSSGCSCLAAAADGDADMTAELLSVTSEAEIENLSADAQGAIAACWPDA